MLLNHKTTREWLKNQPIWHDRDMVKAVLFGIAIGILVGFIWGYGVGAPDLSGVTYTGLKG